MATIISEGENVNWKEKVTCKSCGTVFGVDAKDVEACDKEKNHGHYGEVICPKCKEINRVYNIPPHVVKQVQEKFKPKTKKWHIW